MGRTVDHISAYDQTGCGEVLRPFQRPTLLRQSALEFLTNHQGQERAEDMAANRLVLLVVNRARCEQRLYRAEDRLTIQSCSYASAATFIARPVFVRSTHLPSYWASGGDPGLIDGEPGALRLQKPPKLLIPDERLVALRQRLLQRGDNGLAVLPILVRLVRIETDDIAAVVAPQVARADSAAFGRLFAGPTLALVRSCAVRRQQLTQRVYLTASPATTLRGSPIHIPSLARTCRTGSLVA
jgi:hypothetical protein